MASCKLPIVLVICWIALVKENISLTIGLWPGTKWCGVGNGAKSFEDIAEGSYAETDKCCREHDNCPMIIPPFNYKYGAFNWSLWPMLDCECDRQFYECLQKQRAGSKVAHAVGLFYFDKVLKKCFSRDNSTMTSKIFDTPKFHKGSWSIPALG